jgi:hypothetical protein
MAKTIHRVRKWRATLISLGCTPEMIDQYLELIRTGQWPDTNNYSTLQELAWEIRYVCGRAA